MHRNIMLSVIFMPGCVPGSGSGRIQRFSDLFDTPGEIPQPEEFIKSESGRFWAIEAGTANSPSCWGHKLSGRADYPGISRLDTVPDTAVMTVKDEESGKEFEAELSLEQVQYIQ